MPAILHFRGRAKKTDINLRSAWSTLGVPARLGNRVKSCHKEDMMTGRSFLGSNHVDLYAIPQ